MMFICPKCKKNLVKKEKQYICESGHSFDISASGYVNLILGSKPSHGDNKIMIMARRRFLQTGKYSMIIDTLATILKTLLPESHLSPVIIDSGCGEGYYTSALKNKFANAEFYGFDVSKEAIILASKADKTVNFSVASVKNMPFPDNCADILLSLFSPLCEDEFYRTMKPGASLITVSPTPRHLFGLKSKIYDTPYENPPSTFVPKYLNKINEFTATDVITLENNDEISDLFTMTPYSYNTGKNEREKVGILETLTTEIGFVFGIYKK